MPHWFGKRDLRSATYERMLPGDGDLDLARFVRVLESNAARPRYIGPEVLSKALWEMPPTSLVVVFAHTHVEGARAVPVGLIDG